MDSWRGETSVNHLNTMESIVQKYAMNMYYIYLTRTNTSMCVTGSKREISHIFCLSIKPTLPPRHMSRTNSFKDANGFKRNWAPVEPIVSRGDVLQGTASERKVK